MHHKTSTERFQSNYQFVAVVRAIEGDPVRLLRNFVAGKSPAKGRNNSPA
jgi:hypothetical protein